MSKVQVKARVTVRKMTLIVGRAKAAAEEWNKIFFWVFCWKHAVWLRQWIVCIESHYISIQRIFTMVLLHSHWSAVIIEFKYVFPVFVQTLAKSCVFARQSSCSTFTERCSRLANRNIAAMCLEMEKLLFKHVSSPFLIYYHSTCQPIYHPASET